MNFLKISICLVATLVMAGCGSSLSQKAAPAAVTDENGDQVTIQPEIVLVELKESEITRECTQAQAQTLISFEATILQSNANVEKAKDKKVAQIINEATKAITLCDSLVAGLGVHGACHITKKLVTAPNKLKISYYDQFRVDQKCQKTEKYLVLHEARPDNIQTPSVIEAPVLDKPPTKPPVVVTPPSAPPVTGSLRQCANDEFSRIKEMAAQLDVANIQIDKLGGAANWKYESSAISSANTARESCEKLITYHDQQPCERKVEQNIRQYTGASLRSRCEKARTYSYEYFQNLKSLNFKGADLLLDVSGFSEKVFEADYVNEIQGCRVENRSGAPIDYSSKGLVEVKDSRGFEARMMVLETAEGLLVQCYGLNVDGPFSKRQVVSELKKEGTNMPLVYRLK